jgi:hypothetical protein
MSYLGYMLMLLLSLVIIDVVIVIEYLDKQIDTKQCVLLVVRMNMMRGCLIGDNVVGTHGKFFKLTPSDFFRVN